jgi:hypothetical protein
MRSSSRFRRQASRAVPGSEVRIFISRGSGTHLRPTVAAAEAKQDLNPIYRIRSDALPKRMDRSTARDRGSSWRMGPLRRPGNPIGGISPDPPGRGAGGPCSASRSGRSASRSARSATASSSSPANILAASCRRCGGSGAPAPRGDRAGGRCRRRSDRRRRDPRRSAPGAGPGGQRHQIQGTLAAARAASGMATSRACSTSRSVRISIPTLWVARVRRHCTTSLSVSRRRSPTTCSVVVTNSPSLP